MGAKEVFNRHLSSQYDVWLYSFRMMALLSNTQVYQMTSLPPPQLVKKKRTALRILHWTLWPSVKLKSLWPPLKLKMKSRDKATKSWCVLLQFPRQCQLFPSESQTFPRPRQKVRSPSQNRQRVKPLRMSFWCLRWVYFNRNYNKLQIDYK